MVEATTAALTARAKQLDQKRRATEQRLQDIEAELSSMPGAPGLKGKLVDDEKFPRADVDLYKARRLRQEHAMLKNDAKSLLSDLHAAMIAVHESARNSGTASEGQPRLISQQAPQAASSPSADAVPSAEETEPFAHIVSVEAGSPADEAGLQIGDKLCRVGTIGASPGAVNAIAAHLQAWKGQSQTCVVQRNGVRMELPVVPHEWAGRGLLGCVMAPL